MSRTKSLASKLSIAVAIASVGLALVSRSANGGGMMFARFVAFEDLPKFGPIDYTNTNLLGNCTSTSKLKKIYERIEGDAPALLKGPETPIVDPSTGTLYVLTEEANLVSLTDFQPIHDRNDMEDCKSYRMSAKTTLVADLGLGRPLGGALAKDSHGNSVIYVADTLLGLIRVSNFDHHARKLEAEAEAASDDNEDHGDPKGNSLVIPKVEIIASSVFLDGEVSPIRYANDVDIGPITGHVYFTDSSTIRPERWQKVIHPSSTNHNDAGEEKIWTWDTMTAFKRDLLRGERSGRLLRYKPETGEVDVLADGIWFANGVAVDQQNEEFVMVTETSMARELKWYRSDDAGKNRGVEVMVDSLPGFPDGAICSRGSAGDDADGGVRQESVCYAAIPSPKPPIIVILHKLPDYASFILRNLLLQFPSNMLRKIKPVRYGGVAVIRDFGKSSAKMEIIQDPMGKEIGLITGLAVFDRRLYMGSLTNDFVGVYEL